MKTTDSTPPPDGLAATDGSAAKPCPKCGKPMEEAPQWKGMWMCPDYKKALNDSPPFKYKCKGMELTEEGAKLLDEELHKQWSERAAKN